MNNYSEALKLISKVIDDNLPSIEEADGVDEAIAEALLEAGLIAPDLPEPTSFNHRGEPYWETDGNARVRTPGFLPVALIGPFLEGWDMHPPEARDIAYALLAAANYAEEGA